MSSKRSMVALAAVLAVAWMSGEARAQRGRFPRFTPEAIQLTLLGNDKVTEALKLSDEQKPEVAKIVTSLQEERQALFASIQNLSQEERAKKFTEMLEKTKAAWEQCEKILTSEQVERLKQISRQARGAAALEDEDVALALKLTEEQNKQLATIREATQQEMGALFQQGDREAAQKKRAEIQKTASEKSLAVLTDEQKQEFEKLQGEKIDLPAGVLFGGFGRRRPN